MKGIYNQWHTDKVLRRELGKILSEASYVSVHLQRHTLGLTDNDLQRETYTSEKSRGICNTTDRFRQESLREDLLPQRQTCFEPQL